MLILFGECKCNNDELVVPRVAKLQPPREPNVSGVPTDRLFGILVYTPQLHLIEQWIRTTFRNHRTHTTGYDGYSTKANKNIPHLVHFTAPLSPFHHHSMMMASCQLFHFPSVRFKGGTVPRSKLLYFAFLFWCCFFHCFVQINWWFVLPFC